MCPDQRGAADASRWSPSTISAIMRLAFLGVVLDRLPSAPLDRLHRLANRFCMRTPIEYDHPAVPKRLKPSVLQNSSPRATA
jgi:hypothetical protein